MTIGKGRKVARFTEVSLCLRTVGHYSVLSGGQEVTKVMLEGDVVN